MREAPFLEGLEEGMGWRMFVRGVSECVSWIRLMGGEVNVGGVSVSRNDSWGCIALPDRSHTPEKATNVQ